MSGSIVKKVATAASPGSICPDLEDATSLSQSPSLQQVGKASSSSPKPLTHSLPEAVWTKWRQAPGLPTENGEWGEERGVGKGLDSILDLL